MPPIAPPSPALDAALSAAASLLRMEVVFLGGLTDDTFTFLRVHPAPGAPSWPGLAEGTSTARSDSFCHRMLDGAPASTADAAADPAYADAPVREELGICSYVGVPVHDGEGRVVATLCGMDRASVPVEGPALEVLRRLADVVAAHLAPPEESRSGGGVVIRRLPQGSWVVAGDGHPVPDLTSAMALADLLAGELAPSSRPPRADGELDELARLRLSVQQLEHALAARVVVEQAIGVLAERRRVPPRDAFERLRRVARSRGRRVHDLAVEVVASAHSPEVPLPPELAPRRLDPGR